jgi:hypothetical protein
VTDAESTPITGIGELGAGQTELTNTPRRDHTNSAVTSSARRLVIEATIRL